MIIRVRFSRGMNHERRFEAVNGLSLFTSMLPRSARDEYYVIISDRKMAMSPVRPRLASFFKWDVVNKRLSGRNTAANTRKEPSAVPRACACHLEHAPLGHTCCAVKVIDPREEHSV